MCEPTNKDELIRRAIDLLRRSKDAEKVGRHALAEAYWADGIKALKTWEDLTFGPSAPRKHDWSRYPGGTLPRS